jgi:outer membrane protein OmpA-like peptidoglycan-associated protein
MNTAHGKVICTIGLLSMSAASLAGEVKPSTPAEPAGFVTGGVIGAFAAGPIGAVVGAGIGAWLGNRVHRASEASKDEAKLAALQDEKSGLQAQQSELLSERNLLSESNRNLTLQLEDLSQKVQSAQIAKDETADVLDGVQGDVLFRTGSAEITPDLAHQIQVLAQAVAKSPALKIRVDGYADPRGTEEANMKLSQDRANAVRDLLLASGVSEELLEVNAYGKNQSVAVDSDGYALERRVRLTLQADGAAVAQVQENE